jgi:hypothetical protein
MDKYEQEIFNFLTQRENFEAMLKVNNHFGMVKDNLLQNFWNLVATKLQEKIRELPLPNWRLINPQKKDRNDAKLLIYKDSWKLQNETHPFVGVASEHLYTNAYYGVWCNMHSKSIDNPKLKDALSDLRNRLNFKVDTNWWPLWVHGQYNFSSDTYITYILPDRVDTAAEEYAECLISLLPDASKVIDDVMDSF